MRSEFNMDIKVEFGIMDEKNGLKYKIPKTARLYAPSIMHHKNSEVARSHKVNRKRFI